MSSFVQGHVQLPQLQEHRLDNSGCSLSVAGAWPRLLVPFLSGHKPLAAATDEGCIVGLSQLLLLCGLCKAAVCVPLSPCAACRYVEEAEVDDEAEVTADIDEEVRQQDIAGFSEACQQDGAEQLAMSVFTCI